MPDINNLDVTDAPPNCDSLLASRWRWIVLQPTPFCNMNCEYCYLPDRGNTAKMNLDTCQSIAESIRNAGWPALIIWHGGEPLSAGKRHLARAFSIFRETCGDLVHQSLQTNATLIDSEWCRLFKEFEIDVGVSIDGDERANKYRIFRSGRPSFAQAMGGIQELQRHDIRFSVIAVISGRGLEHPRRLYQFVLGLGATSLGVNIEETEGINRASAHSFGAVSQFWKVLFEEWRSDRHLPVRELRQSIQWLQHLAQDKEDTTPQQSIDPFPTVAYNGDVVLLSPEFCGTRCKQYADFVVGNVRSTPLDLLVRDAQNHRYVREYLRGVRQCQADCGYYGLCGGGQASNKFFENEMLISTETAFCKNTYQKPVEAILATLGSGAAEGKK